MGSPIKTFEDDQGEKLDKGRADHEALRRELADNLKGEVRFDEGSRALYATDASNYRQVPHGVVLPLDAEETVRAVGICRSHHAPLLMRGSGTSLAGQCCNAAVVLDVSRHLNQILELDHAGRKARVQPGVILDHLRKAAKPYGLTFGPDPATHNRCTLGGMIGNNSCGVHSIQSGKTADNVESLEILTYDGLRFRVGPTSDAEFAAIQKEGGRKAEIYRRLKSLAEKYGALVRSRYPKIPRRVSGYNLDELLPERGFNLARALVGSEGTCVTILEATVRLIPDPPERVLLVLGFPDIYTAADHVPVLLLQNPIGLEGLDENFVLNMRRAGLHLADLDLLPAGNGWLLAEFGGSTADEARAAAEKTMKVFSSAKAAPAMRLFTEPQEQKKIWSVRESSFGATVFVPGVPDTYSGFEDSAVHPEKLGAYLRDLQKIYDKYGYYAVTYGHFGDGCIHSRISFDLRTDQGLQRYRDFLDEASGLVIRYGGSLSGEHGDGQTWGEYLHKMYGPELVEAFREFKAIWDPDNKMNPGKVVDAYSATENLRLKTYSTIAQPELHFKFAEDGGHFARVTERCIGIGKCLKTDSGIMCPSYMATGEEKHSTRGRAHLLHEMMRGEVIKGGWKDERVKESLDLCLACKGCKKECPVSVDMATYKAEFLSHYYKGRMRPLSAYAFGLIPYAAGAASLFPQAANFFAQNPVTGKLLKKITGIAPQRQLPVFAKQNFRSWFRHKGKREAGEQEVLLWPDTFNNYFYPSTAKAAVEVLEHLGYRVRIPAAALCCGRPLYDYGMLDLAKDFLRKILTALAPDIERGIPLVGLEPGCLSVFRDELPQLFPGDKLAQKLSASSYFFAEFLEKFAGNIAFPLLQGEALVQGHCHEQSLSGMGAEENLLKKTGLQTKLLDAGCCGMAGAFGFEEKNHDISRRIGERLLFPAVRKASGEFIVADGFSCREQIRQFTGKTPLHAAEVLHRALFKSCAD